MPLLNLSVFQKYSQYGALFIRLAFGFQLIHGTQDNVFSYERMLEFRDFLDVRNVPYPLIAAHISVYAQFICGILFILGLWVRPAGICMFINFVAAIIIVHVGLPYQQNFPAINLLAVSAFLVFHGAGALSIDQYLKERYKMNSKVNY